MFCAIFTEPAEGTPVAVDEPAHTSGRESMIWIAMFATVLIGYGWLKVRRRNRKVSQGSN